MTQKSYLYPSKNTRQATDGDAVFEADLRDACASLRHARMAALQTADPAMRKKHHPIIMAAAILAASFCLVAAAAWPKLSMVLRSGKGYMTVENAPSSVDAQQPSFSYLPEGYTLEWLDESGYTAQISYEVPAVTRLGRDTVLTKTFTVRQMPLSESSYGILGENGQPIQEQEWDDIANTYMLRNSPEEITAEDLSAHGILRWSTGRYLYQFSFDYLPQEFNGSLSLKEDPAARNEEIVKILKGITP